MVDIKGLEKARVLKALYDHSHVQGSGFLQAVPDGVVTVEHCEMLLGSQTYFDYLHGRVLKVELSGDEFDERLYDRDCGEGTAQRAVDSVRAEQENGGDADKGAPEGGKDTAGNADSEKKEPSLEEQAEMTKEAVHKILDILKELPPASFAVACMTLKMALGPGPMGGMSAMSALLMMGGPSAPSPFRTTEKPMGWPTGMGPIFGHDLFAHSRNG